MPADAERVAGLAVRFLLFQEIDFGWKIAPLMPVGWFGVELGVELDGKRVNLVQVLLRLLEQSNELPSLRAMARGAGRTIALPVEGHGYVRVEPERLKRLFEVLGAQQAARRIGSRSDGQTACMDCAIADVQRNAPLRLGMKGNRAQEKEAKGGGQNPRKSKPHTIHSRTPGCRIRYLPRHQSMRAVPQGKRNCTAKQADGSRLR